MDYRRAPPTRLLFVATFELCDECLTQTSHCALTDGPNTLSAIFLTKFRRAISHPKAIFAPDDAMLGFCSL